MANAFSHIEHSVAGHFRLNFYAAIFHVVNALRSLGNRSGVPLDKTLQEHSFLASYLAQIEPHMSGELSWDGMLAWWQREITAWENEAALDLPLAALSREGRLSFAGRLALMIAALVEEDSRFGTLFEALQSPLASRRPSLELIGRVLMNGPAAPEEDAWKTCSELLASGLVEVPNREAPHSEWTIKLPSAIWHMIRGEHPADILPGCEFIGAESFPSIASLILDDDLRERLRQLPSLIEGGRVRTLVVRGASGSDQLQVLGALARALGRGLAVVSVAAEKAGDGLNGQRANLPLLLGPLCIMGRYLPVFVYDLAPGETAEVPSMPSYDGPLGIALGLEGGISGAAAKGALTVTLPFPASEQRLRCWRQALNSHFSTDLETLNGRFLLPAGHIRQAAAMAIGHAALDARGDVEVRDIREACRALNRQMLDNYAALVEGGGSWRDLVVSPGTAVRLNDFELRCRHRERLLKHLGSAFTNGCNRGVRALFTGASGTGKTLAARIIAAELGMDLYRVDLGAVVNKYIGETEKNLHQVLSRAEALDVVLLLDEGDALLGNRTEVKTANDRYANLETNYLLQRLETYQGIVIITTNAAQYIDRAFQRRMDVVVLFVHPQAEERREIWRLHLPAQYAVGDDLLEEVVVRCALTGGQIRNAALYATLLAVEEGDGIVRDLHLEAAVRNEYRKAGATCPLDGNGVAAQRRGIAAFLEVMRS